jgi:TetR/AcrR family transcriptional repressor of nem operon
MRRSDAETIETRKRIIEVAGEEFMRRGIVTTRVDDVMAAAGLTRGAFYRHFESKDELFRLSFGQALTRYTDLIREKGQSSDNGIGAIIGFYLSVPHRDNAAHGCPVAALGGELTRSDPGLGGDILERLEDLVSTLAEQIDESENKSRRLAIAAYSTMVGAITLSRLVAGSGLSEEILEIGRNDIQGRIGV